MLRAEMLGGFRVWWQDQPLQFSSRQARSLLAYLLVYPQPQPRDHLAGLFWPDLSDDQARKRLSQTLWQIRQGLLEGSDWIRADADAVGWSQTARPQTDLEPFVAALKGANLEGFKQALELYQGEFLHGYYDDWVLEERDHLLQTLLAKLEQLIRHYRSLGEPKEALEMARKLAALEPLHDEAHQEVMRLCLLMGKPREALEHFRRAKAALEELGEQPGPQLEALRQQAELVRESPRQTSSPLEGSGGLMLVGRSAELELLLEALGRVQQGQGGVQQGQGGVQQGQGGVALLEGEAGMGKSRLLQELVREGGWRGFGVLQAKATERSPFTSYGLLREALETGLSPLQLEQLRTQLEAPYLQAVGQVVSALAPKGSGVALRPEDESGRMREALVRLLQGLARWSPQLLLLDDLHWADQGTLEVLPHLARSLRGTPVLLVLGYRSSEARERPPVWDTVQKLSAYVGVRAELKRLSPVETAELVRRSLGLPWSVPRFEARVYRETQGNPLFVLETLRSLYEEGLLHRDSDGTWSTPIDEHTDDYRELPLAPTVRQVIVERLRRLSEANRSVADALAVLGAAELEVLAETIDKPRVEVLNTVATLMRQGLLIEREGKLAFAHDKIAQAAYEEIPDEVRRQRHGRVGEVLEARGVLPEELAGHFAEAGLWSKAATAYRLGGERAEAMYVLANAVESYSRALELSDRAKLSPAEQIHLLKKRSSLLSILDRKQEFFADIETLERLTDDAKGRCDLHIRRALEWVNLGHVEKGRQEAQRVLEQAKAEGWTQTQIRALGTLALADQRSGKREEALAKRQQALALALELGDPAVEAENRHLLGTALLLVQRYSESKAQIKQALKLIPKANNLYRRTQMVGRLGPIWQALGNYKAAEAVYRYAIKIFRMLGSIRSEASSCINWAQLAESRGQVGLALGLYGRAIEVFAAEENLEGEASARVNLATLQALWLAEHHDASHNAQIAQKFYAGVGDLNGQTYCEMVFALIERNQGEVAKAYQRLSSEKFRSQGQKNRWLGVQLELLLAELSIDKDDLTAAAQHLEIVEDTAKTFGMAALQEDIAEVRAHILLANHKPLEASQLLEALPLEDKPNHHRQYLRYQAFKALNQLAEAQAALQQARQDLLGALRDLSPEQVQASLEHIPEHRLILQTWEAQNIQRQTFRIPSADAPTGRPLRDDEYVEIAWTTHTPEDDQVADKTERRQLQLKRLLAEAEQQGAAPTLDDLAEALGSSKATLKRDMAALRAEGVELKTRGSRV